MKKVQRTGFMFNTVELFLIQGKVHYFTKNDFMWRILFFICDFYHTTYKSDFWTLKLLFFWEPNGFG